MHKASGKYLEDNRMKLNKSKQCLQEPWFGATDLLSKRAMRVAGVSEDSEICCQGFNENL